MTRVKFKNTVIVPRSTNKATKPDKQFVFKIYWSPKEGKISTRIWVPKRYNSKKTFIACTQKKIAFSFRVQSTFTL